MSEVEYIKLSDIVIPEDRQRKEHPEDHIRELADSIARVGLFHPLLFDGRTLVAGNCRRQALLLLEKQGKSYLFNTDTVSPGFAPFTTKAEDVDPFLAELEENIRRRDLSVLERASAIARLHKVKVEETPEWTQRDTAVEVASMEGGSVDALAQEVAASLLLDAMMDDPDVQRAAETGGRSRAAHVARKKLLATFEAASVESHPDDGLISFKQADSREAIRAYPDKTFDGIVADPPYGVDADSFGDLTKDHKYEDDWQTACDWVDLLAREGYRICRDQAHLYLFCDIEFFPLWKEFFEQAGWWVWRTPLIWHKPNSSRTPQIDFGPARQYETILFANKGKKKILRNSAPDILTHSIDHSSHRHPAGKPTSLYTDILSRSFGAGDHILDPCVGGGDIFLAARHLRIRVDGYETDTEWSALALAKVK